MHSEANAEAFTKEHFVKDCEGDFGTWSNFVKISDFKSIAYNKCGILKRHIKAGILELL